MTRFAVSLFAFFVSFGLSAAYVNAAPITGPGGDITGVTTTATLTNTNGGSLNPNATIDGVTTGVGGTFVEWPFQATETFTYTLNGPYNITRFLLWNDRGVPDSGIDNFDLIFKDPGGGTVGTFNGNTVPFQGSNPVPEVFSVGFQPNVKTIDLRVNSALNPAANTNVQFREVEFEGTLVPEPASLGIFAIGCAGLLMRRRRGGLRHAAKSARSAKSTQRCASVLVLAIAAGVLMFAGQEQAQAKLGGFEVADGYTMSFVNDVWSYDAGASGAAFLPAQYNTGRWKEIFGSSNPSAFPQYVSRHGYGGGGANSPPFALAVRSRQLSPDGSFDMTVQYDVGADDTGVAPTTPLLSASITFDICPGRTFHASGIDSTFNDVRAFSLSIGGTDAAPGATVGFSDPDPSQPSFRPRLFWDDGATYNSVDVPWSNHFDQLTVDIDFVTQTYDLTWTQDFLFATTDFDPGNAPVVIATNVALTSPINTLEQMYFRAHTDPSDGTQIAGLEKSFLDNFVFDVRPVPEPTSLALVAAGLGCGAIRPRRQGQSR